MHHSCIYNIHTWCTFVYLALDFYFIFHFFFIGMFLFYFLRIFPRCSDSCFLFVFFFWFCCRQEVYLFLSHVLRYNNKIEGKDAQAYCIRCIASQRISYSKHLKICSVGRHNVVEFYLHIRGLIFQFAKENGFRPCILSCADGTNCMCLHKRHKHVAHFSDTTSYVAIYLPENNSDNFQSNSSSMFARAIFFFLLSFYICLSVCPFMLHNLGSFFVVRLRILTVCVYLWKVSRFNFIWLLPRRTLKDFDVFKWCLRSTRHVLCYDSPFFYIFFSAVFQSFHYICWSISPLDILISFCFDCALESPVNCGWMWIACMKPQRSQVKIADPCTKDSGKHGTEVNEQKAKQTSARKKKKKEKNENTKIFLEHEKLDNSYFILFRLDIASAKLLPTMFSLGFLSCSSPQTILIRYSSSFVCHTQIVIWCCDCDCCRRYWYRRFSPSTVGCNNAQEYSPAKNAKKIILKAIGKVTHLADGTPPVKLNALNHTNCNAFRAAACTR